MGLFQPDTCCAICETKQGDDEHFDKCRILFDDGIRRLSFVCPECMAEYDLRGESDADEELDLEIGYEPPHYVPKESMAEHAISAVDDEDEPELGNIDKGDR